MKYFIKLGHKKIALINGPKTTSPCLQLEKGFLKAMRESNVHVINSYLKECNLKMAGGYNTMKALLKLNKANLPTAVLFISDMTAIGAYEAISEAGFRIPDDISIIGCDDIPEAKHLSPSLTTIAQPRYELGKKGMSLILKELKNKSFMPKQSIKLLPELIIRKSTAPPKE